MSRDYSLSFAAADPLRPEAAAEARRLAEAEAARPTAAEKQEAAEAARAQVAPQKLDAEEIKRRINTRMENDKDFRDKALEQGPIEAFRDWFTRKR
jgi:hypothetical protein